MSFADDQYDVMVGGSNDFPQRVLNESYVQQAPLAFAPTTGPKKSYKKVSGNSEETPSTSVVKEIQDEQQNLSDRLDKLENEVPQKTRSAKEFWKKHHKKIKTGLLVGVALYAGYRLFLKDKFSFKFGGGGHTPMDSAPPPMSMESGGEITSGDI